jgi:hypothetical protein
MAALLLFGEQGQKQREKLRIVLQEGEQRLDERTVANCAGAVAALPGQDRVGLGQQGLLLVSQRQFSGGCGGVRRRADQNRRAGLKLGDAVAEVRNTRVEVDCRGRKIRASVDKGFEKIGDLVTRRDNLMVITAGPLERDLPGVALL